METDTDKDIVRLTRAIHEFVRGKSSWEKSLQLFDEILDSEEWLDFLLMEQALHNLYNPSMDRHSFANSIDYSFLLSDL